VKSEPNCKALRLFEAFSRTLWTPPLCPQPLDHIPYVHGCRYVFGKRWEFLVKLHRHQSGIVLGLFCEKVKGFVVGGWGDALPPVQHFLGFFHSNTKHFSDLKKTLSLKKKEISIGERHGQLRPLEGYCRCGTMVWTTE
jgi:hypothetical protein